MKIIFGDSGDSISRNDGKMQVSWCKYEMHKRFIQKNVFLAKNIPVSIWDAYENSFMRQNFYIIGKKGLLGQT